MEGQQGSEDSQSGGESQGSNRSFGNVKDQSGEGSGSQQNQQGARGQGQGSGSQSSTDTQDQSGDASGQGDAQQRREGSEGQRSSEPENRNGDGSSGLEESGRRIQQFLENMALSRVISRVAYAANSYEEAEDVAARALVDGRSLSYGKLGTFGMLLESYRSVKPTIWQPDIWAEAMRWAISVSRGSRGLRQNTRLWSGVEIIPKLKGFAKRSKGNIIIILDASGSMTEYIEKLVGASMAAVAEGITVSWAVHADVTKLWHPGTDLPSVGYGTQFCSAVPVIEESGATAVLWLTDGYLADDSQWNSLKGSLPPIGWLLVGRSKDDPLGFLGPSDVYWFVGN